VCNFHVARLLPLGLTFSLLSGILIVKKITDEGRHGWYCAAALPGY
jgi:hypothetical protein